jgi:hypothetical protein
VPARWAKSRDANEPPIVAALRQMGATVIIADHPDLIVGFQNKTFLIELKTKGGRLTRSQEQLCSMWNGGPLAVLYTLDEVIAFVTS